MYLPQFGQIGVNLYSFLLFPFWKCEITVLIQRCLGRIFVLTIFLSFFHVYRLSFYLSVSQLPWVCKSGLFPDFWKSLFLSGQKNLLLSTSTCVNKNRPNHLQRRLLTISMIFVTEDLSILAFICLWNGRHPLHISKLMFSVMDHVIPLSLSFSIYPMSDYPTPLHGNMSSD